MKKMIALLILVAPGSSLAGEYSFSDYAADSGLTGNESEIRAVDEGITNLDGLAENYDLLQNLYLSRNKIESLEIRSFYGLDSLNNIYLDNNLITNLYSGIFGGHGQVESLFLNNNRITNIGNGDLNGLGNLSYLHLEHNLITNIEPAAFEWFGALKELYMNNNKITSISFGDLSGLANLHTLHLDNNNISSIDRDSFDSLRNLKVLNLDYNYELSGEDVIALLNEIDTLEYLSVEGIFDHWSDSVKTELYAWNSIEGHTLVPEPASLIVFGLGGLVLLRRRG